MLDEGAKRATTCHLFLPRYASEELDGRKGLPYTQIFLFSHVLPPHLTKDQESSSKAN